LLLAAVLLLSVIILAVVLILVLQRGAGKADGPIAGFETVLELLGAVVLTG
jgi:hypothetical protein